MSNQLYRSFPQSWRQFFEACWAGLIRFIHEHPATAANLGALIGILGLSALRVLVMASF